LKGDHRNGGILLHERCERFQIIFLLLVEFEAGQSLEVLGCLGARSLAMDWSWQVQAASGLVGIRQISNRDTPDLKTGRCAFDRSPPRESSDSLGSKRRADSSIKAACSFFGVLPFSSQTNVLTVLTGQGD